MTNLLFLSLVLAGPLVMPEAVAAPAATTTLRKAYPNRLRRTRHRLHRQSQLRLRRARRRA